uniref:FAA_hydrolase domain-containing protein n=1 Tax=Rhabditophanes sp. KR3021 TaxID=114890 RepID=A0AC35U5C7_9BILA
MSSLVNFREVAKKIVCVGRNYVEHAKELGNAVPKVPMIFLKSTNSLVGEEGEVRIPPGCNDLHQEVELGVIIGKLASQITKEKAMDYVAGYTIALDMTARDFQDEAKKNGAPWFLAKSFDTSCVIGDFIPKEKIPNPQAVEIYCLINGKPQQRCSTDKMIFDIPTLISYVSKYATLNVGDVLLTGTPSGVTRVVSGDIITFGITDITEAKIKVA